VAKQKWEGCLGVEGAFTGDRRIIEPGVLSWTDNFPKPIRWAASDEGKHTGAEVVGHINFLARRPGKDDRQEIWGFGTFDTDAEKGAEAARQVKEKLTNGVSLDLDNIAFDVTTSEEFGQTGGEDAEVMSITGARVRAVTLVALPAFEEAHINLVDAWSMLPDEIEAFSVGGGASTSPDNESTSDSVGDEFDPDNEDEETGALAQAAAVIDTAAEELGLDNTDSNAASTQSSYKVPEALATCTNNECDQTPVIAVVLDDDEQNDGPDLYCQDHYQQVYPNGVGGGDEDNPNGATLPLEIVPDGVPMSLLSSVVFMNDSADPRQEAPAIIASHGGHLCWPPTLSGSGGIDDDTQTPCDSCPHPGGHHDSKSAIGACNIENCECPGWSDVNWHEAEGVVEEPAGDVDDGEAEQMKELASAAPRVFDAGELHVRVPALFVTTVPGGGSIAFGANGSTQLAGGSAAASEVLDQKDLEKKIEKDRDELEKEHGILENDSEGGEFKQHGGWGKNNWVAKAGGLPPYIKSIKNHLEAKGMETGHAIAVAVNVCKKACATGDLNWPGHQSENAGSRAKACAAIAHWESMKAKAHASDESDGAFAATVATWSNEQLEELSAQSTEELTSQQVDELDLGLSDEEQTKLASTDFKTPAEDVDPESFELYVAFADDGTAEFRQYSKSTIEAYVKKGYALEGGSYPIASVQDLRNAIQAFGRAGSNKAEVKAHIKKRARALKRTDLIPGSWAVEKRDRAALVASGAVKLAAPIKPPKAWFDDPQFKMATPLTVTKEGRVFGHLATWGTCHTAQPNGAGECVTVPGSGNGYNWFHTGVVETEEGPDVTVGRITMKTGHAADSFNSRAAIAHYENTGLAIADVHAGEDQFGVWISGALRPDATEMDIRALKASPLSGDWRWSDQTNNLELVMALAVNMPGFPVPRPHGLVASGALVSLVAAGMLPPSTVSREQVERAKEDPNGLDAGTIRYLKRLAQKARDDEANSLKRRALVASGAEERIRAMASKLSNTQIKTED
jgi:hypothetical protein